jgi:hypothetical protein
MRRVLCLAVLVLAGCGSEPRLTSEPAPTGTLFLAGREPGTMTRVDVTAGTATSHRVPQLNGGDPPYMVAYTGGRVVVFGPGRTTSLAPDLSDPRSLGEAWFFVPSATPGRVWNILLQGGNTATRIRFRGVREVGVDGTPTQARHAPVPGWPLGATRDGLLIQADNHLSVWDPISARIVRRVPGLLPLGIRPDLVAACPNTCKAVHFTDGRTVRGPFENAISGAFSPDGRRLAVATESGRIVLIEGTTWRYLPKARTGDYPALTWSSSGWLFYGVGAHRIGAWRPGTSARVLPMSVDKFVAMAAD